MRRLPRIGVCITSLGASKDELAALKTLIKNNRSLNNVVIYGDIQANNIFDSRSVEDRLGSLIAATENSDIVVAWNGGFNSVELLPWIENTKVNADTIFAGYSDNTILVNALASAGIAGGWMGPMAKNWITNPDLINAWIQNLTDLYNQDYTAVTSSYNNLGMKVYKDGKMTGKVWGGNNYTFDLLQGTKFCPSFTEPFILLLEGENLITDTKRVWQDFVRNLDSIMLQPGAQENLKGLLVGKFPDSYVLDYEEVNASFEQRGYLSDVPIAYNFPRGYCTEQLYLPIGEGLKITLNQNNTIILNKV